MRRQRRRQENEKTNKNILYIGGSVLAIGIIAFAITFILYGNKMEEQSSIGEEKIAKIVQEAANTTTQSISTQMGKTVEESKNEITNTINTVTNTTTENTTTKKEVSNTKNTVNTNKKQTETTKTETQTFIKPVEGEIVKQFAKESLVYSETLQEWTTHLGIDIKAEKTTVVKASEAGKVKSIKNDPRYGLTIIIEHQDGYETLYANLLSSEFVKVGEEVKQGQSIGTVGSSAPFEIADAEHLHFEITKDGEQIDPSNVIK